MKRKVKKKPIIILIVVIILIIAGISGYLYYKYINSTEYKLKELGYNEKEISTIVKLDNKQIDSLLEKDYNKDIVPFLKQKYFIWDNLNKYLKYKEENDKDYKDVIALVNVGATKDWYTDSQVTDMTKGNLILVNKFNLLKPEYKPTNIVDVSNWYAYEGISIKKEAYEAFKSMFEDAKSAGLKIIINSGYRTEEYQTSLYNDYKDWYGTKYADDYAARPNASEHQTGFALDIIKPGSKGSEFKDTDEYKWLVKNSYKYGFILRYPEGKEYITGYAYESWHYRYLGKEVAKKVYDSGITYDEYYAYYIDKKEVK